MSLPTVPCAACRRSIAWVRTAKGRSMPLDPEPNEEGNVIVERLPGGGLIAHVFKAAGPNPIGTRFMPHFATCPSYKRKGRK